MREWNNEAELAEIFREAVEKISDPYYSCGLGNERRFTFIQWIMKEMEFILEFVEGSRAEIEKLLVTSSLFLETAFWEDAFSVIYPDKDIDSLYNTAIELADNPSLWLDYMNKCSLLDQPALRKAILRKVSLGRRAFFFLMSAMRYLGYQVTLDTLMVMAENYPEGLIQQSGWIVSYIGSMEKAKERELPTIVANWKAEAWEEFRNRHGKEGFNSTAACELYKKVVENLDPIKSRTLLLHLGEFPLSLSLLAAMRVSAEVEEESWDVTPGFLGAVRLIIRTVLQMDKLDPQGRLIKRLRESITRKTFPYVYRIGIEECKKIAKPFFESWLDDLLREEGRRFGWTFGKVQTHRSGSFLHYQVRISSTMVVNHQIETSWKNGCKSCRVIEFVSPNETVLVPTSFYSLREVYKSANGFRICEARLHPLKPLPEYLFQ